MMRVDAVVVGAGMAGLSAAARLAEHGRIAVVLEASDAVGGKVRSHQVGGLQLDAGAEALLFRRPEAAALIEAAGRASDTVHPAVQGASIWTDQLKALPTTQLLGIPADLDDPALLTLLGEADVARAREEPHLAQGSADVSVGQCLRTQLGDGVVDGLVEPLLGGVYAGHADQISFDMAIPGFLEVARETGSVVAAASALRAASQQASASPLFASVPGGLGSLPASLIEQQGLTVHLESAVSSITGRPGQWVVATASGEEFETESVVVTAPAFEVAPLLGDAAPELAAVASALSYASVALVTMVFDRVGLPGLPPGTGCLVPPFTGRLTKAATFLSQKWQWVRDAAPDHEVVRFSVGRYGDERALDLSDAALTEAVVAEVRDVLGVVDGPSASAVTHWARSLPQYPVGHRSRVVTARQALPLGIAVAGAAWDGVGIPACVASGWAAADAAVKGQ